ncbi:MAG: YcgL domain-containing protein [Gammaproteobacteria bacterium]|nr:MAG: YcgL domain-containing protein [Gammaproteobacteria bacterium]
MSQAVKVYRSSVKPDMYLFVADHEQLARVPAELMKRFGRPIEALSIELNDEMVLARANAVTVLEQIRKEGFYLQLPPASEDWRS